MRNGDVYVNGQIARKPPQVQEHMWMHVFDSAYVPLEEVVPTWDVPHHPASGALKLDALDAEQPVLVTFGRRIKDFYAYNGVQNGYGDDPRAPGRHDVGDLRLEALVTVRRSRPGATVVLRLTEGQHRFAFSVPATGEPGTAVLTDRGQPVAEAPVEGLRPGEDVRLALEHYDERVVTKVRGKPVIPPHEYEGNPTPSVPQQQAVQLGALRADVVFQRVRIQRDVHYAYADDKQGKAHVYELGQDEYFVLGDNNPSSSDSRAWPSPGVPADNLLGAAFAVFWPVHDLEWLSAGKQTH